MEKYYLPEGMRYATLDERRRFYTEEFDLEKVADWLGQELAFDLDPENITCPIHGSLVDKMKRGQGLGFCSLELDMAKRQALSLHEYLEKDFSQMRIVYSGRGFHIHVFDEKAYELKEKERREIARTVKKKGFAIDGAGAVGEMRLIRVGYS